MQYLFEGFIQFTGLLCRLLLLDLHADLGLVELPFQLVYGLIDVLFLLVYCLLLDSQLNQSLLKLFFLLDDRILLLGEILRMQGVN